MAEKISFTTKRIKAIEPPAKGRKYYRDTKTASLELCVTQAGSKTYYCYKWYDGRPNRIRLGTVDEMSLEAARNATKAIIGEIAIGKDPAEERRIRKQEAKLGDVWQDWFENHAKLRKRTWEDDERMWNKYLVPLHKLRLSRLTTSRIAKWHSQLGKDSGHHQANRCRTLLSALLNYAVKIEILTSNPCKSVPAFPEKSRERFLLPSEMKTFFDALAKVGEPWCDFFQMALFTGARRSNVQAMRWSEIDFVQQVWTIPGDKAKSGSPVVIPLPPPAIFILKSRLEVATSSPYVFASRSKTGHIVEPKGAWQEVRKISGLKDLRMHDLRRSLGSWQAQAGANLAVIAASLGHSNLKSVQVYSRLQIDPVRLSVDGAVEAMRKAGGLVESETIGVEGNEDE